MGFTIRNFKIRRQILLITLPPLFGLLCLVGIAFAAYRSVANCNQTALRSKERVVRNQSFWGHAAQIYHAVQRYVAREDTALAHYDEFVADGRADLNALAELEAADPWHVQEVAEMRAQFEAFLNVWAQPTIDSARAGGDYNSDAAVTEGQQRLNAMGTKAYKLRKRG